MPIGTAVEVPENYNAMAPRIGRVVSTTRSSFKVRFDQLGTDADITLGQQRYRIVQEEERPAAAAKRSHRGRQTAEPEQKRRRRQEGVPPPTGGATPQAGAAPWLASTATATHTTLPDASRGDCWSGESSLPIKQEIAEPAAIKQEVTEHLAEMVAGRPGTPPGLPPAAQERAAAAPATEEGGGNEERAGSGDGASPEQACLDPDDLSEEEDMIEQADVLKAAGNDFFKDQRYAEACSKYTEAIAAVDAGGATPAQTLAQVSAGEEIVKSCLLNRAASNLKLDKPSDANADCEKVLELDPQSVKALFRKSQALSQMAPEGAGDANSALLKEAKDTLRKAANLEPKNTQVRKAYREVLARIQGGSPTKDDCAAKEAAERAAIEKADEERRRLDAARRAGEQAALYRDAAASCNATSAQVQAVAVGTKVRKFFEGYGTFNGRVESIDYESFDEPSYLVRYEDSEEEELSDWQVCELIVASSPQPRPLPGAPPGRAAGTAAAAARAATPPREAANLDQTVSWRARGGGGPRVDDADEDWQPEKTQDNAPKNTGGRPRTKDHPQAPAEVAALVARRMAAGEAASPFYGVVWDDKPGGYFLAKLWHNSKHLILGRFAAELDAARSVDAEARRLRGAQAHGGHSSSHHRGNKYSQTWRLNFPTAEEAAAVAKQDEELAARRRNADASEARAKQRQEAGQRASPFIGVSWNKLSRVWRADIGVPSTDRGTKSSSSTSCCGNFGSEEEAARSYDSAARKLRGAMAHTPHIKRSHRRAKPWQLNFPTAEEQAVVEAGVIPEPVPAAPRAADPRAAEPEVPPSPGAAAAAPPPSPAA